MILIAPEQTIVLKIHSDVLTNSKKGHFNLNALTCSSTAGIEAIAQNIPTAFLTGFCDHENDEIAVRMAAKFGSSGLIVDLSDAHFLNFSIGLEDWRVQNLSTAIGTDSLLMAIENFKSHPPKDVGLMPMARGALQTSKEHWLFLKGID